MHFEVLYLKFSIFNEIFKFVEGKLMIRILSSIEGNSIFVITFVFPRLKLFCERVVNYFFWVFFFFRFFKSIIFVITNNSHNASG